MDEKEKIQRMLLWFEAQLPEHDMGEWLMEIRPHREIVLDETNTMRAGGIKSYGLLVGIGRCLRCRSEFIFDEPWGNYCVSDPSEQEQLAKEYPTLTTEYKIEEMKGLVQKKAQKSGKCWGDVPKIEKRPHYATPN